MYQGTEPVTYERVLRYLKENTTVSEADLKEILETEYAVKELKRGIYYGSFVYFVGDRIAFNSDLILLNDDDEDEDDEED